MPRPLHPLLATMLALTACAEAKQETTAPTQDASTASSPAADIKAGDPGDGGRPSTVPPDAASAILDGQATDTAPAQDVPSDTQVADDAGVDVPLAPPTVTQLKVVITAPPSGAIVEVGESVGFIGVATDSFYGPEDLLLAWSTSSGDVIQEGAPGPAGRPSRLDTGGGSVRHPWEQGSHPDGHHAQWAIGLDEREHRGLHLG